MYKALIDFSGVVSMKKGEVKEIADKSIVNDLVKAGYIEIYEPAPSKATTTKVKKKNPKKGE